MEVAKNKTTSQLPNQSNLEQEVRELTLQRNILESQVKFGVDSLRIEQKKVRNLEERLSELTGVESNLTP